MFVARKIAQTLFFVALIVASFNVPISLAQQSGVPQVDSMTLVDATTGDDLVVYTINSGVATGSVFVDDATEISLMFNTSNAASVRISGVSSTPRVESVEPFSLLGDDVNSYEPWSPSIGVYTIEVEPFSGVGASGVQGANATLTFTVIGMPTGEVFSNGFELQHHTVVFVGSSIVQHAFGQSLTETHSEMMALLEANGLDNIDFYGYGHSGQTVAGILPKVNDVLTIFPQAKVILMIGGNDVTRTRPYATRPQEEIDAFTADMEALIERFNGIEDQLILVPLTYSSYAFPGLDDSMFLDGSPGVEPYNVNEYLPRIPDNQKNIDGNHVLDLFNFTRNNRFHFSGSDGIHYNIVGIEAKRQFIADRLGYLINGGQLPEIVERDEPPTID